MVASCVAPAGSPRSTTRRSSQRRGKRLSGCRTRPNGRPERNATRAVLPSGLGAAYMGTMPMQRLAVLVASLSFALSALAQPDAAADYPNHPVRIIVSASAGGGVDTVTRIIAERL